MMILLASCILAGGDHEAAAKLLESRCAECHNRAKFEGGLDLTSRAALLKGGETGPAIAAQPEKSLLYQLVSHQKKPAMPHKREKLADAELVLLAEWIRAGTPYDRELKPPAAEKKAFAIT